MAPISTICSATGFAGALTIAIALVATPHPWRSPGLFAVFTIALAALHSVPMRLAHQGDLEGMQLEEALFVPMAILLSPAETLIAFVCAEALGHAWRRRGGRKALFNVGQIVTTAGIGLAVSRGVGAATGRTDVRAIAGAATGAFVFPVLSAMAVAGIISVAQRTGWVAVLLDGGPTRVATWAGSLSLGIVALLATQNAPWAIAFVLVPVVVVQIAYAGARVQWRERQRIQALYEAASSIRSSIDPAEVRAHLLAEAQRQLESAHAQIVDAIGDEDPAAVRAELGDGLAVEVSGRVGGGTFDTGDQAMLRALAGVAAGALQNALLFEEVGTERRKLAEVVESTSDGILTVDADGRIVSWNPAMVRISGREEADVVGRQPAAVLCPPAANELGGEGTDDNGVGNDLAAIDPFAGNDDSGPRLVRIETVAGAERWITVTRSPLPAGGAVIVARDETAKKEVDDLKADFLATISHELRTPLTPIKGYLAMLGSEPEPDADRRRAFVEVMARQTARLERLIGDLLDATSLRNTQLYLPDHVDWSAAVVDVVALVRNQFGEHDIVIETNPNLPEVLADAQRAEQVLGNLIVNACKYSPLHTTVRVTLHREQVNGRDMVRTTVNDEGPGVPLPDRERIFERFTRLGDHMRRTVGGAGLGLFIARQLVEAMGGTISVGDSPAGGAAFTFTLPVASAIAEVAVIDGSTTDISRAAV